MPQHVREPRNIAAHTIEAARKQMAQVMRKHFSRVNARFPAQRLHLRPNLLSRYALSASGEEYLAGSDFFLPEIFFQLTAKLSRNQDRPDLALQSNLCAAPAHRLDGDILQLRDTDAGRANRLKDKGKPFLAETDCRGNQLLILRLRQLAGRIAKHAALDTKRLHPAFLPSDKLQKSVHRRDLAIDRNRGKPGSAKVFFPFGNPLLVMLS